MEQLNIFDYLNESKTKPIRKIAKEIKPKTTKQFDIGFSYGRIWSILKQKGSAFWH